MAQLIRGINRPNLETKLGRVPNVAGEGVVDSSLRASQLQQGLSQLSTSLKAFGKASDRRRIQNDIITARTAFAVNEEMPGSLAPEAELTYNNLVAEKSTQQFFRLLADNAEAFGNGVLADDKVYPDHNAKQAAYEDFIDASKAEFFNQAQFTEAQQASLLQFVSDRTNTLKVGFSKLAAKDIKALKLNESAQFVQENILDNKTKYEQLQQSDLSVTVKPSVFFNRQWHEDLKKRLGEANPQLTQDELDELIIDQIGLIATDPDNPHPEYLEYFKEPGKRGKPALSIVPNLSSKLRDMYVKSRNAFISNHKASIAEQNQKDKEDEELAFKGAQAEVITQIGSIKGQRNLTKLTTLIKEKYPKLEGTKLQSVINFANTLISASGKEGDAQITTRMLNEASTGKLDLVEFENDPRKDHLSQDQIVAVNQQIFNYGLGQTDAKRKNVNEEADNLRQQIAIAFKSKQDVHFGGKSYRLGKNEKIRFDALTGKPVGLTGINSAVTDSIINQYLDGAETILLDERNETASDVRRELSKLKHETLRSLQLLDIPKQSIQIGQTRDSSIEVFDPVDTFNNLQASEPEVSTGLLVDDPRVTRTPVPKQYNPKIHIPPTPNLIEKLKFGVEEAKKTFQSGAVSQAFTDTDQQTIQSFAESLDDMSPEPIKETNKKKETVNEKESPKPSDILPSVPMGAVETDTVKPDLTIPQQRKQAFDQAFPDVPNERNELRKLQDTAEFQSDETIIDAVKEGAQNIKAVIQEAIGPNDAASVKDVIDGYVGVEEPIKSRIKYIFRIRDFTRQLKNGTLSKERKANLNKLETFLSKNINKAFNVERKTLGISVLEVITRMRNVYMGETDLGTNVQDSSTGAIGELQVLPSTFRSTIKQTQFGKKAAEVVGLDIKELRKMNDEELRELLRIPEVNFMAATAKMFQFLKHQKDKK